MAHEQSDKKEKRKKKKQTQKLKKKTQNVLHDKGIISNQ